MSPSFLPSHCRHSMLIVEYWSDDDGSFVLKLTVAYSGTTSVLSETSTGLWEARLASFLGAGIGVWSVWRLGGSVPEFFFKLQLSMMLWYISLPRWDLKLKNPSPDSQRRPASMPNPSCKHSQITMPQHMSSRGCSEGSKAETCQ